MIDLYVATNTNYEVNGNMELLPTSCIVNAEINGAWTLSLIHPIDEDGRWEYISEGAVIKVRSFNGIQLFRIKRVQKQDSGIQALAEPIFLDAVGDCFNYDVRPTNATGGAALTAILSANSKYSGSSNISIRSTAYYILKNAMECIAGSEESSFLNRWGGEIEYNNHQIIINTRIGEDRGVELLYGKNIPTDGMKETISIEEVVTRVVPKAFNGRLISSGNKYVNSPLINNYPTITTKVVEYPHIIYKPDLQGEAQEGDIICNTLTQLNTALRNAAAEEFSEGNIDKPLISIECDMVLLQNTEEYKDFASLETVSLGDTIHCNHSRLGIRSDARIVALTWNCLTKAVEDVKIGMVEPNYLQRVESVLQRTEKAITPQGDVIASQVSGFLDASKTQLRAQSTQATPMDVVAILFEDLDTSSPTFGALALGTQGLQVSRTRTNDEWDWGTAITSEGIIANYVVAGILSDKNSINYWNLDTGEFRLSSSTTVGGQTVNQIATAAANAAVSGQTQQDIFNKLTNNGASQGIYLNNGQLYINGTYIQAGQINANLITAGVIKDAANKNSWNLTTGAFSTSGAVVSGGSITGATINNGSGTFQVDASGNLKASSAEITGSIKSGSTITGSTISGGTVTGTAINNGSGTFQVDSSGNLTATSASITGSITGSTISGSVITTTGDDANYDYTSSLDNGKIVFTRTGKSSHAYDGTISIEGGALIADFDQANSKATISNTIRVENKTNDNQVVILPGAVSVKQTANSYVQIGTDNIAIYVNGTRVWSAR